MPDDRAPRAQTEFVAWLVDRHPQLASALTEHLRDNAELLPHVFFGDVTRYAANLARRASGSAEAGDKLHLLLHDLDSALLRSTEDDPVDNLIWVSFVENAQGGR